MKKIKEKKDEIRINIFFNSNCLSIKEVLELDFSNFINKYLKKYAI